ncbi:phosphoglucosamine mutase [Primorskyibacter flagellatus]|uniref:Phosphoglucosamine mutase n=1 Tax=Primorskyibacter flagellatus TaxID=1387277 RepID=A0A917AA68_9RHOB|nr:phosphoglucosamine mutase [Primorskyibacter flagellatus]GGE38311.1 phosphoglucosamine mutase [Primorskyibacter flagellatus]
MTRSLFGTDGVRGRTNTYPMTAEVALQLAAAAGRYFRRDQQEHRVVIGKDTRLSGYMLENALTAGFTSTGMNVFLLGPVPTPGVGFLTRSMRADVGVMISASHNPAEDNGIKFFGPDGHKLSDEAETEIERLMSEGVAPAHPQRIGRAKRIDDSGSRYVEYVKTTFPRHLRLDGLRIVVDCANGAAHRVGPAILWELGADVIPVGTTPNGLNINDKCGSTHPAVAAAKVRETRADIGLCLDGDADRLILIDQDGEIVDGDQIMGLIASRWKEQGRLQGDTLVTTVMSNLGLERFLYGIGITMERTKVGDRYVVERMREGQFNLGGEQSGHIVMTDFATTGDGLVAALQVLAAMVETGRTASDLACVFTPIPQVLHNVRFRTGSEPLAVDAVQQAIADGEKALGPSGRLLIRKSGTEPLIRVMGESEDQDKLHAVIDSIRQAVEHAS